MSAHSHLSDGLGGKGWSKTNMEATASKENLTGTLMIACCVRYLDCVFSHGVVVEAGLGPELFLALLALQGVLELKGYTTKERIR